MKWGADGTHRTVQRSLILAQLTSDPTMLPPTLGPTVPFLIKLWLHLTRGWGCRTLASPPTSPIY